ncbi:hypothetical protein CYMTET_19656, partial [Cymbomonas tetramitiformis]
TPTFSLGALKPYTDGMLALKVVRADVEWLKEMKDDAYSELKGAERRQAQRAEKNLDTLNTLSEEELAAFDQICDGTFGLVDHVEGLEQCRSMLSKVNLLGWLCIRFRTNALTDELRSVSDVPTISLSMNLTGLPLFELFSNITLVDCPVPNKQRTKSLKAALATILRTSSLVVCPVECPKRLAVGARMEFSKEEKSSILVSDAFTSTELIVFVMVPKSAEVSTRRIERSVANDIIGDPTKTRNVYVIRLPDPAVDGATAPPAPPEADTSAGAAGGAQSRREEQAQEEGPISLHEAYGNVMGTRAVSLLREIFVFVLNEVMKQLEEPLDTCITRSKMLHLEATSQIAFEKQSQRMSLFRKQWEPRLARWDDLVENLLVTRMRALRRLGLPSLDALRERFCPAFPNYCKDDTGARAKG